MTTTTPTDLLRAVLVQAADPDRAADDTPRLVFADRIEECGQPERAELIRVQCELARRADGCHRPEPDDADGVPPWCGNCVERYALRRRERELLNARGYGFCDGLLGPGWKTAGGEKAANVVRVHYHRPAASRGDRHRTDSIAWAFRRGFVEEVELSAADWLRHADAMAWRPGWTDPCPQPGYEDGEPHALCPVCRWTGRVPRPLHPTAQPVTRVVLTGEPVVETDRCADYTDQRVRLPGRGWVPFTSLTHAMAEIDRHGQRGATALSLARLEWPGVAFGWA